MKFALFMSHPSGRVIRIVAGLAILALGFVLNSVLGIVLIVVGIVFVIVGSVNVCLIAPLLRVPFTGKAVQARATAPRV